VTSETARPLTTADARLTRMLQMHAESCATVSEYSAATGIDTARILELLTPALDQNVLSLEPVGSEVFVHTAPDGRNAPGIRPHVAANLWERLRSHSGKEEAHQLWSIYRSLQRGGWTVEANHHRIASTMGRTANPPRLAVNANGTLAPLLIYPSSFELCEPSGPLAHLASAGAHLVSVLTPSGGLDDAVTAVRAHHTLTRTGSPVVLVLEAPRFAPVVVTPDASAVAPASLHLPQ